jgi:hypothetical protein
MTIKEFIQEIDKGRYSYRRIGDVVIVNIVMGDNSSNIDFDSVKGLIFQGKGDLGLYFVKSIPTGVHFNNNGDVSFKYLESISPGVEFNNRGGVWLGSLSGNNYFHRWEGNISDINNKRLLNLMISKGLFER